MLRASARDQRVGPLLDEFVARYPQAAAAHHVRGLRRVLFDALALRERNDYLAPLARNEGIDRVWVHGEALLDGRRLHRPAHLAGRALLPAA